MALTKAQRALRVEWMNALRSGEYAQTTGVLRRRGEDAGFCCLGVACDVIDPDRWEVRPNHVGMHWDEEYTNIPGEVRSALALGYEDSERLIEMNDFTENTFEEIADAIDFLTRAGL